MGYQILRKYGLTLEQYDEMMAAQDGRCLICKMSEKLNVDHDHESGKVRGLLCLKCNTGLGMFSDNATVIARAAVYLEKNHE